MHPEGEKTTAANDNKSDKIYEEKTEKDDKNKKEEKQDK